MTVYSIKHFEKEWHNEVLAHEYKSQTLHKNWQLFKKSWPQRWFTSKLVWNKCEEPGIKLNTTIYGDLFIWKCFQNTVLSSTLTFLKSFFFESARKKRIGTNDYLTFLFFKPNPSLILKQCLTLNVSSSVKNHLFFFRILVFEKNLNF